MKNYIKGLVAAAIVLAVLFIGGNYNQEPEAPVYTSVQNEVVEVTTQEDVEVEEVKPETKKGVNKGSNEKIVVTRENTENLEEGKTTVEGSETTTIVAPKANEDNKVIEEAKKDETKVVEELGENITVVTEKVEEPKTETQPKKEETTKVEIPEEVVEVKSEEAKKVETAPVVEEQNDSTPVVEEDFDTEIDFSQFGF